MSKRKGLWIAGGVAFLLLMVFFVPTVVVYRDFAYVCENTASMYGYREWPTGYRSGHWSKASPLEKFMNAHWPGVVEHRWTSIAGTGKNVFGQSILFGHGSPGGAYWLRGDALQSWIEHHTDPEIRALYDFLTKADKKSSDIRAKQILSEEVVFAR